MKMKSKNGRGGVQTKKGNLWEKNPPKKSLKKQMFIKYVQT